MPSKTGRFHRSLFHMENKFSQKNKQGIGIHLAVQCPVKIIFLVTIQQNSI